jgi:hypothetical protein
MQDSGHTLGPTLRIKEKQRIKEYSYMEQACSNIAMQRIVDTHTNYMVRARPKCKNGRGDLQALVCQWETLRTPIRLPKCGGLQGMDRAITTYRLPLNYGALSPSKVFMHPGTMPVYKETTHIASRLRPYGLTSIGHGQTRRNDELPPQLSSNSNHISYMKD